MGIDISIINEEIKKLNGERDWLYAVFRSTTDPEARDKIEWDNKMKTERLKALIWVIERAGVVENFAHEPTKEPLTEALNKHDVSGRFLPPNEDGYQKCTNCGKWNHPDEVAKTCR